MSRLARRASRVAALSAAAVIILIAFLDRPAFAASAEKGRETFVAKGCWQCHGFAGQGGAGTRLAPDPLPLEGLTAFVRNTRGRMPPYPEAILSNEDLADIHAYLQSIPKAADYRSIPLLRP